MYYFCLVPMYKIEISMVEVCNYFIIYFFYYSEGTVGELYEIDKTIS